MKPLIPSKTRAAVRCSRLVRFLPAIGAAFTWWVVAVHLPDENVSAIRLIASLGWFSIFARWMGAATGQKSNDKIRGDEPETRP